MAQSPLRPVDDEARAQARGLLRTATFAALAVKDPQDGYPAISRIALAQSADGCPMSVISDLSGHTAALKAHPACALLLGEPEERGDPLTHPRLSIKAQARFVRRDMPDYSGLAVQYLAQRPKARLYIGFGDFSIVVFDPVSGLLNAGFGKAFALSASDMLPRQGG